MGQFLKNIVLPVSMLAGTIIGAGIFSLPYIFNTAGIGTGFFYLLFFVLIFFFIYLLYADVIIRTPGEHRLVSYAKMYLGEGGFVASVLIGVIFLLFSLTVYLILAPSFSKLIVGGNIFYHVLAFWFLGSLAILLNTKRIAFIEFLITAGIISVIFIIFIFGLGGISGKEISWQSFNPMNFLAIGPILFSLAGSVAIPEIISYFRESSIPLSYFKKVLFFGILIPALVYILFVIGVLGLSPAVSGDAITGLISNIPGIVVIAIGILGFLSLLSTYIIIGLNVSRVFEYDFSLPKWVGRGLIIFTPLILYLSGFQSFIGLVDFSGRIFLPLEMILIVFIWIYANRVLRNPSVLVTVNKIIYFLIAFVLLVFITVLFYGILK